MSLFADSPRAAVCRRLLTALLLAVIAWPATAGEIVVSAAASLTTAFNAIGEAFERAHPADRVVFNFGGSGQLLRQIERGAPVDVFAAADQETMDRAFAAGLIDASTRADFTRNALVLIVPADSTSGISGLDGLSLPGVRRIALSNPETVPVGRYARAVLENAGLWDLLGPKLINSQNARQSLDYVARGEVDAGFVYATDAAVMPAKVRVAAEIATAAAIAYPIAAVRDSGQMPIARSFIDFVLGDDAQRILRNHGFRPLR